MTGPCIVMRNFGGLANRMIRFMFAERLAGELGGWPVVGHSLPEWGLMGAVVDPLPGTGFRTGPGHRQDVVALAHRARAEGAGHIEVDSFAQRLEYFAHARARYAALFSAPPGEAVGDHELAINVRTGDIVDGYHRDYTPLPLAFYRRLVNETGLAPVFVGEVAQDNWYTRDLRAAFPDARYVSAGVIGDFQTMRGARNVVLAVSTYSWLAAWLSDRAETIHMPLAGLFNPVQRDDVDLVVQGDPRWGFHAFAPGHFVASPAQKAVLTRSSAVVEAFSGEGGEAGAYLGYRLA